MAHDDEFDPFIAEIARELKAPVGIDARLDARVMAALEPAVIPIGVHRVSRPWYRRTISFSVTQVAGLAAAAALVGVIGVDLLDRSRGSSDMVATAVDSSLTLTPVAELKGAVPEAVSQQFLLIAPGATSVSLVGDFNDWDASALVMERVSSDGAWSVTVPLLPGRYEYQFLVDGKARVTDPTRPQTSSEFGSANSVVTVEPKN